MKKVSIWTAIAIFVLALAYGIYRTANNDAAAYHAEPPQEFTQPVGYSDEIAPYINFLEKSANTDPVDYVMDLFGTHDIVVLCERDHRDLTQYEMIYDIVSDERFIEQSGCVFCEVGSQTVDDRLNAFLRDDHLSGRGIDKQLLGIYRDMEWSTRWEKYNTYDFWKKVLVLNTTLPDDKKISIHPSDMPVDWPGMDSEKYQREINDKLDDRDRIMADFIAARFKDMQSNSAGKKILVIMNYRHAFKLMEGNTTQYLDEYFPGQVANVMINSAKPLPGSTDHESINAPIHNGKWDAAFRYLGNPSVGFDFAGTPFGEDYFDYFTYSSHHYAYQNIFDGFIFYRPLEEHLLVWNIPGFIDRAFYAEFIKRLRIIRDIDPNEVSYKALRNECNRISSMRDPQINTYNAAIERWLAY